MQNQCNETFLFKKYVSRTSGRGRNSQVQPGIVRYNAEKTNLVFLKGASSISNMMLRGTLANYMARYCILWQLMASYVNLWQLFTTYGFLWQLMAIFVICHQAFLPFSILYLRSALLPASLNSIFYIWPSL